MESPWPYTQLLRQIDEEIEAVEADLRPLRERLQEAAGRLDTLNRRRSVIAEMAAEKGGIPSGPVDLQPVVPLTAMSKTDAVERVLQETHPGSVHLREVHRKLVAGGVNISIAGTSAALAHLKRSRGSVVDTEDRGFWTFVPPEEREGEGLPA